ncbi:MAG TPA: hypothetical protein VEB19_07705 [Gemmatimonadaceae bacterium]|nr:hypothetical protein [Gemmatimonadaceae bacterium]
MRNADGIERPGALSKATVAKPSKHRLATSSDSGMATVAVRAMLDDQNSTDVSTAQKSRLKEVVADLRQNQRVTHPAACQLLDERMARVVPP